MPPCVEAQRLAGVVLAEVDGLAHVGVGLGPRLAGLEDHRARPARPGDRATRPPPGPALRPAPRPASRAQTSAGASRPWRRPRRPARRRSRPTWLRRARTDRDRPRRGARRCPTRRPPTTAGIHDPAGRAACASIARAERRPVGRVVPAPHRLGRVRREGAHAAATGSGSGGARSAASSARWLALAHEALVGGVLQQPPNQVGHPRHQVSDRGVDVDLRAERAHGARPGRPPSRRASGSWRSPGSSAEVVGGRDGVGDRADVVRGERRLHGRSAVGVRGQQEAGAALVAGVGVRLVLVDRHRPAVGSGQHRLGVPVGALHQPHGDRTGLPGAPVPAGRGGRPRCRAGRPG